MKISAFDYDSELRDFNDKVLKRKKERDRYDTPQTVLLFLMLGLIILAASSLDSIFWLSACSTVFVIIIIVIMIFLSRKSRYIPRLTPEETVFLKIFSAYDNMKSYLEGNLNPQEEFLKMKASETLNKVKELLESDTWKWGLLQITQKEVGEPLQEFQRNLGEVLIPAISKGDKNILHNSSIALTHILLFLHEPSLKTLSDANIFMSKMPKIPVKPEIRLSEKVSRYSFILMAIGCIVLGGIIYSVGVHLAGISAESVFAPSVGAPAAIFAAYLFGYYKKGK